MSETMSGGRRGGTPVESTCSEVEERMADVLDGTAPEALFDHVADCDHCRDARHDAEQTLALVAAAGLDFVVPSDFEARLLAAVEATDLAAPAPVSVTRDDTLPSARAERVTGEQTAPSADEPPASEPALRTQPLPEVTAHRQEASASAASLDVVLVPEGARGTDAIETAPAPPTEPGPLPTLVAAPAAHGSAAPTAQGAAARPRLAAPSRAVSRSRLRWFSVAAVGVAAAAAALALLPGKHRGPGWTAGAGWSGSLARVSRSGGGAGGVELCDEQGKACQPLAAGAAVAAGHVLKTDAQTRAQLQLADGSEVTLDRNTSLSLGTSQARQASLLGGALVADIAHRDGETAGFALPHGKVTVLGTKFSLRAFGDSGAVEVSRGSVELEDGESHKVTVRAGEQGRVDAGRAPTVGGAAHLAETLAWSESTIAEPDEPIQSRGLGELRAKKADSTAELKGAVQLSSHSVKVRISGTMARTEVDETFDNSTGDVLEGIYRFPLPPDARIERLALEVDGKLEEGAFVDRERAAAIWRGAIVHAAPQMRRQFQEEIVWVPGPWRDPALLEWQRGGRFELRIFPIPKHGSRRVILAYTQLIAPSAGARRYTYPLAHDPSGSTRVGRFDVDVQVRGHDAAFGVRSEGYALDHGKQDDADTLHLSASGFVPSGDLGIEYALPERDADLTAWAYEPEPGELHAPKALPAPSGAPAAASEPTTEPTVPDTAPYAAIALRPRLPRVEGAERRAFVIVVDSSRSMFGESYQRATRLATRLVRELGSEDRFTVLACDASCRSLPGGLQSPSPASVADAQNFLKGITPEGASDPTSAVRAARAAASAAPDRQLHVVYLGDGTPTVGPVRPATVEHAVQRELDGARATLTAVAVGSDSDSDTLAALARGGSGVVLPFVPGQSTAEAAYAVLGACSGQTLQELSVDLPEGLTEVAPKRMDAVAAGGETMLMARMDRPQVKGEVVLHGKLAGRDFEQRYPLELSASRAKGNGFVPRLWASARIADLERDAAASSRKEAVRLSGAFDVASRHTSLLVLESAAMFRAFGLDNHRDSTGWTGEEDAVTTRGNQWGDDSASASESDKGGREKDNAGEELESQAESAELGTLGALGAGSSGAGRLGGSHSAETKPARPDDGFGDAPRSAPAPTMAAPPPPAKMSPPRGANDGSSRWAPPVTSPGFDGPRWEPPRRPRPPTDWQSRPMIPMRRIWERKGAVSTDSVVPKAASLSAIAEAERQVAANDNRRDAVKKLYTLYALAGDLDRARPLAERWAEKEPLDPEALTARADLAARGGDRELAIRVLGSVVDVRPSDTRSQERLARLERWAGHPAAGCRYSVALAELHPGDARLLTTAVACARQTGESRLAEELLRSADEPTHKSAEAQLAKWTAPSDALRGDFQVEASWSGGADLDLALLHPAGHRVSWLGAPTKGLITARDVASSSGEGLALSGAEAGEYVVEIVRAGGEGDVSGSVTITVAGTRRTVPFVLRGSRVTVALATLRMESRLVPLGGWRSW